ncbi:unnamed protein product [Orchesella dallaii]|uniref:Gustatory receptor n=1 Tax=Orchesella dallaii TaxID=48710 RepID=A0ABP1SAT6_9HEXA
MQLIGASEDRSTEIGFYLYSSSIGANILIRVGLMVSMKFYHHKYLKAVHTVSVSSCSKHLYTVKKFIQSIVVCGTSFSVVLLKTHIGLYDGMENYIIANANHAWSLSCFTWPCRHVNLVGVNPTTFAFGIFGWASRFAGNLLEQIARDGILLSALTLGNCATAFRFKKRLKDANEIPIDAVTVGTEIRNEYKWIKKVSKHINSAFNIVFRFFLLANIFMFAVFVDEWFNPQVGKVAKGVKLVNVVFVCITFYYANQTAKTGDRFREWMKKEKNRTALGMSEMEVVMENSSWSSIGFGRGALYIYDSTLIGFASAVAAYYFGIVETRPQYIEYEPENCCVCTNTTNSSSF